MTENERRNLEKEKIIGIDEAGRGPLAGPVCASAVFLKKEPEFISGIKDSKKISEKKREKIYQKIITCSDIIFSIASINHDEIDRINILQATKKAMELAVKNLENIDGLVVIDGNFLINIKRRQIAIPKADETILECSIASILSKVSRDRVMRDFDRVYPHYGFIKNKGYPTKVHKKAIKKYGHCPIHRKTFRFI